MRRAIETVPKDGQVVILEDDTSGTYEVARWSAQECAWVGENDKPCKITPTHWLAIKRAERPSQQESSDPSNLEPQLQIWGQAEPRLPRLLGQLAGRAELRLPPAAQITGRVEPRLPPVAPDIFVTRPIAKPAPAIVATFDEKTIDER